MLTGKKYAATWYGADDVFVRGIGKFHPGGSIKNLSEEQKLLLEQTGMLAIGAHEMGYFDIYEDGDSDTE